MIKYNSYVEYQEKINSLGLYIKIDEYNTNSHSVFNIIRISCKVCIKIAVLM